MDLEGTLEALRAYRKNDPDFVGLQPPRPPPTLPCSSRHLFLFPCFPPALSRVIYVEEVRVSKGLGRKLDKELVDLSIKNLSGVPTIGSHLDKFG